MDKVRQAMQDANTIMEHVNALQMQGKISRDERISIALEFGNVIRGLQEAVAEKDQLLKEVEDLRHRRCDYCGEEYDDSYPELEDVEEEDEE